MVVIPSVKVFSTLSQGTELVSDKLSALELNSIVFAGVDSTP